MKQVQVVVTMILLVFCSAYSQAQQTVATNTNVAVPPLVNFSGTLADLNGKPLTGTVGVTFLLYKDPQGGAPLWLETQNVQPDSRGRYTVTLGSTRTTGLPSDIFVAGEAHWLGVQIAGQEEQPRVLLVAVPYALKAGDAQTVGGLPPSAFVLAAPNAVGAASAPAANTAGSANSTPPPATSNVTTTGGSVNSIPLFTTATNIQNSILTQTSGAINVGGKLNLPATGTATAGGGKNSQPETHVASAYNSSTKAAVAQTFELQAEAAGNNTSTPSGTLNLLFGSGTTTPSETGLKISNKGLITFAAGQAFPGTGKGSVTSVGLTAPASDFKVTGSPVTTSGTLNLAWTVAPTTVDTANAIVKRDAGGNFAAGAITANTLTANGATINGLVSIPAGASNAISASSSSTFATTIFGDATSTTGEAWGVAGYTDSTASNAYGVIGDSAATSGTPIGVYGVTGAFQGIGVWGQQGVESTSAAALAAAGWGPGVWGDGGTAGQAGVIGTSDADLAGYFVSSSSVSDAVFIQALNSGVLSFIAGYGSSAGSLSAYCDIDGGGNINCTGAKNAVVPVDGGARTVALAAIESPANWFEDAGEAELNHGSAIVALDSIFTQTVNTGVKYQVFLTPYGDCKGLYVTNRTAGSFEVHELGGGTSSLSFGYRIMALRKNYEHVRFADHTRDMDAMKHMRARPRPAAAPGSHNPGPKSLRGVTLLPVGALGAR